MQCPNEGGRNWIEKRRSYSRSRQSKPGAKGPAPELTRAIVELKHRHPRFGCSRIAQPLAKSFGIESDKDVVRRVLPIAA